MQHVLRSAQKLANGPERLATGAGKRFMNQFTRCRRDGHCTYLRSVLSTSAMFRISAAGVPNFECQVLAVGAGPGACSALSECRLGRALWRYIRTIFISEPKSEAPEACAEVSVSHEDHAEVRGHCVHMWGSLQLQQLLRLACPLSVRRKLPQRLRTLWVATCD